MRIASSEGLLVGVKPLVETLNCGFAVVYSKITYDPWSLIGSHGCELNHTILCSK